MDSDNASFYSENEFYYPEEYGKEKDERNSNTILQNNQKLNEIRLLHENTENTTRKTCTYDLNVWSRKGGKKIRGNTCK